MSHDPLTPFEYSKSIELPGGPVVLVEQVRAVQPAPPARRMLVGAGGALQQYEAPANQVAEVKVHRIPRDRNPFTAPVVVDLGRLTTITKAMSHLCFSEVEARVSGNFELGGMKIGFDGHDTLTFEASDRTQHGVAMLLARSLGATAPWSLIVPPMAFARGLSELSPGSIEIAPAGRLLAGPLTIQLLEGGQVFPPRPPRPLDLEGPHEIKETAFQCILRRSDLKLALKVLGGIIDPRNVRANMRHIYAGPEEKMLAGSNSDAAGALFQRVDLRSKPRIEHPYGFHLPVGAARAAYLLGDDGAVVVDGHQAIIMSMTKTRTLVIGGLDVQDHFIRIEPSIQIGVAKFSDILVDSVNHVTVKRDALVEAMMRSAEIHKDNKKSGFASIYLGDNKLVVTTSCRDDEDAIREDMEREIPYVRAAAGSMFTRTMVYRPDLFLAALETIEGAEVTLGYPRNASGRDPVTIIGADQHRLAMLMPIVLGKDGNGEACDTAC